MSKLLEKQIYVCPKCGNRESIIGRGYIKGTANRIHWIFACNKCNLRYSVREYTTLIRLLSITTEDGEVGRWGRLCLDSNTQK